MKMSKTSKLGLFVYLLNFIVMFVLIGLSRQIPGFMVYIFWASIIVTIGGGLNRKASKLTVR